MSSLLALPTELLLHIAAHLPDAALAALARTAAPLAPVAQRVLYRHVAVSAASRNRAIVLLLARNHHIARCVRSFYIALDPLEPLFRPFYLSLATAIHNMSDLHSLHLLIHADASWVLRDAAPSPNLVSFSSTFALDHHVVRFLHKTPSLLELEVDAVPTAPPPALALPDSCIPHLEQFSGSSRAAGLVVPGRPLKSIHLSGTCLTEDDIPLLARSSAPVLVLGAPTNASPVAFLGLLHRHLPHLVYLRVMSTQNLFQPPSAEFYEQVADALASFSELNAFELSGMHWGSQRKPDDDSKRVWQSSPFSTTSHPTDDHDLWFGTDIFLAY